MLQIIECEQNSAAWYAARIGVPTASMFKAVLAKGEGLTRKSYLHRLAGEIITGEPTETFQSQAMERGHLMEAEARELYAFAHDAELQQVGFIRNGNVGCSPDRLIATDGVLEIKTTRSDLMVDVLLKNEVPTEHRAQIQGNMWVAERAFVDVVIYWPKMPLFVKRVTRDEPYIANLASEIARFNDELAQTVEKLKRYGAT